MPRNYRTAASKKHNQTADHLKAVIMTSNTLDTPIMVSAHPVALHARAIRTALPTVSAPTRLRLPDLLRITDEHAGEVLRGRYNHLLPPVGVPTHERGFTRLHSEDELEVWLISWVRDRATELHDHGGSLGALTLLSGALGECSWDGEQLRHRRLAAGDQAAFPLGWVHDVTWAPGDQAPALSVHAYSPPLTTMSFYEVTERQTLRRVRTALTETPEPQ